MYHFNFSWSDNSHLPGASLPHRQNTWGEGPLLATVGPAILVDATLAGATYLSTLLPDGRGLLQQGCSLCRTSLRVILEESRAASLLFASIVASIPRPGVHCRSRASANVDVTAESCLSSTRPWWFTHNSCRRSSHPSLLIFTPTPSPRY